MAHTTKVVPSFDRSLRLALRHVRDAKKLCRPFDLPEMLEELGYLEAALLELGAPVTRRRAGDPIRPC